MGKDKENNIPLTAAQNGNEKMDENKKYNFYRKPSIKKKAPEVKQTLTSYRRMLKANPLLKYEMEGKDFSLISKQISSSSKVNSASGRQSPQMAQPDRKLSLQPNKSGKLLSTNLQRSKSLKNPPMNFSQPKPLKKTASSSIITGCKPTKGANTNSINISKHVEFSTSSADFLCSTPFENAKGDQNKKRVLNKSKHVAKTKTKDELLTQDNCVSSSEQLVVPAKNNKKVKKPMRRSLSAQHFDCKKGIVRLEPEKCYTRVELTQSLSDISSLPSAPPHTISPIAEGSRESSVIFKTPSAYERRSIARFTPKSVASVRRSLYYAATPLPSLNDLQKRLNDWLTKRGKSLSTFHHLKCFGVQEDDQMIDEENKENIEVDGGAIKGSYEDLKIIVSPENRAGEPALNAESSESVAKAALEDLLRLIQEGYPRAQCEGWLELIRRKYRKLEEEPQYWECRAAVEQSRGNISNAVQCYKAAIVQGAEIQAVDESLDILLKKFSLLNISTDQVESEKSAKERARIVQDARNVFKSSIIQFAVQERKLKKNQKEEESKTLVATPVRRSTRLSRSAYTCTPGVKICSSLRDNFDMVMVDFKKNKALF